MAKRLLVYGFLLAVLVAGGAALALAWLLGTEDGLHWALSRAVVASQGKLAIDDAGGRLAGSVRMARLAYEGDGFKVELRDVTASADLVAGLAGRLVLGPLHASSLAVELRERDAEPRRQTALGFGVRLWDADIDSVSLLREGERYELESVRIDTATLDAGPPVAIAAKAAFLIADERFPARGQLEIDGTLERIQVGVRLEDGGTSVDAKAMLMPSAPRPLQSLEARAGPVDLARFGEGLPSTALELTLRGSAGAADALRGTLTLRNAKPGPLDAGLAPFARLDARFASADFSAIRLEAVRIALPGGGRLEGEARASAGRAHALLQASGVDLRALRSNLRRTALQGPLEVVVTPETQLVDATLREGDMTLDARVVRRGAQLDVRRLRASAAGGEASGSGRLELAAALPFRADLTFSRFDPAAFGDYPAGAISGNVSLVGRLGGERDIDARWNVAESTLAGQRLTSRGSANFSRHRVRQADAEATLGEARATVRGAFGRPRDELAWTLDAPSLTPIDARLEGRVRASGVLAGSWERPEGRLTARADGLRFDGGRRLDVVEARVSGSLARHDAEISLRAPEIDLEADLRGGWSGGGWAGELRSLVNTGRYPLRLVSPAPLRFARERFELGRLEALLGEGHLRIQQLRWAPGALASEGEFRRLPAHWVLLIAGATRHLGGDLALDGEWAFSAAPRLDGALRLRRADGDLEILGDSPVVLGLGEAMIDARFVQSRVAVQAHARSRFGNLRASGEIRPAPDAQGLGLGSTSTLALEGQIAFADAHLLSRALLENGRLEGKLSAELQASGTLGEPQLRGQLRGEALALELPPYGVYLKNGDLRASLQGDRLRIDSFTIKGGAGEFSASGSLPLRLADGEARIAWTATRFTVIDRPELNLVTSGRGEAHFDGSRLALSGDLRADRGHLEIARERLPKLADDVWIVGSDRPAVRRGGPLPVSLDVHLDLGDNLDVRAQGLEGKLAGHLDFSTGEDGELRAYGKVETVNATFLAYGQQLQVSPGILVFDGPLDNPALQITAWRRNLPVEAGVQVTGTVRAPRVQVVSQPPVPEGERLSWLVLGRPPSDATKADLGMLQAAAGALLSRGDTMPLDRKIARAFGLDELTLRGTGEAQDRVVALGKRLSDRLYISYEQGIGTVASNLVKMDYSLSRRWSLRAETGTSSGGGLFYRFSWD